MSAGPPPSTTARPLSPASVVAVLVGGFCGTALRLGVDTLVVHEPTDLALSTLIVNVTGSFLLGLLVASSWRRLAPWARAGLGAGLLGSFTTFSALTDSLWILVLAGAVVEAVLSVALSLGLGLGAAVAGIVLGRRLGPDGSVPLTDGSDE
jgi:fluoride exporter